jgi:hypothetical protein
MKKILFLLLLTAFVCFVPAGCGGEKSYRVNTGAGGAASNGAQSKPAETMEVRYSEDAKKSVALPAGYPGDRFPVYEGSFIAAVQAYEGGFIVTCFSKDHHDKVAAFYKQLLQNAQVIAVTDNDKEYVSTGVKDGYTYTVAIGESTELKGYPTSLGIALVPAEEGMEEALKKMPGFGGKNQ